MATAKKTSKPDEGRVALSAAVRKGIFETFGSELSKVNVREVDQQGGRRRGEDIEVILAGDRKYKVLILRVQGSDEGEE